MALIASMHFMNQTSLSLTLSMAFFETRKPRLCVVHFVCEIHLHALHHGFTAPPTSLQSKCIFTQKWLLPALHGIYSAVASIVVCESDVPLWYSTLLPTPSSSGGLLTTSYHIWPKQDNGFRLLSFQSCGKLPTPKTS